MTKETQPSKSLLPTQNEEHRINEILSCLIPSSNLDKVFAERSGGEFISLTGMGIDLMKIDESPNVGDWHVIDSWAEDAVIDVTISEVKTLDEAVVAGWKHYQERMILNILKNAELTSI